MKFNDRNPIFFMFNDFVSQQNFVNDLQFFTKKRFVTYPILTFSNNITYTSLKMNPTEDLDEQFTFLSSIYTNYHGNKDKYILYFSWDTYQSFKKTMEKLKKSYYNPKLDAFYNVFYRLLKY